MISPDNAKTTPGKNGAGRSPFDHEILSEHKAQLQAYGVIPGYALRLQQQKPVIVIQVDHTELAFDYDLAKEIFVEEGAIILEKILGFTCSSRRLPLQSG